jgi:hypothetical protein
MSQRSFSLVAGTIFSCIALLHLLRLVLGWEAIIGAWIMPAWFSWAALPIAAYLAYQGFRSGKNRS